MIVCVANQRGGELGVKEVPGNLGERIRELRRRHFGPRGKEQLATKLGVPLAEFERYERNTIPPADVLVRLCEITGEDLQWLLTGVASRGTVVISGARGRHQVLLAKVAQLVESRPQLAASIEAFLDLLAGESKRGPEAPRRLPQRRRELIPIFESDELPDRLELTAGETATALALAFEPPPADAGKTAARMAEPSAQYQNARFHAVNILQSREERAARRYVECPELSDCAEALFGVSISSDEMSPMFLPGDTAIVSAASPSRVGRPTFLKLAKERAARCRMWLGESDDLINLGRISDGAIERIEPARILWSYEVIYRVAAA